MMPMSPFIVLGITDIVGNTLAFGAIAAMAYFGFRHGLFLAVVSALVVLTGFFMAVALSPSLATHVESTGLSTAASLPVAYAAILFVILAVSRVAVGGIFTDEDVRFRPVVDRFGGAAVGALAGVMLGGALLVGWSMCELSHVWRLNAPAMSWDSGARCLWAFVRWLEPDEGKRKLLFQGNAAKEKVDKEKQANVANKVIWASEPFDDADGSWTREENERFLDYDKDEKFTLDQEVVDGPHGKADVRDAGLIDRYWLSAWRTLRVLHRPRITSPEFNASEEVARAGELIYTAIAVDPDDEDKIQYSLSGGGDALLLQIDPDKGEVRFRDESVDPELKKVTFTVLATDRSGLIDEHEVSITLRPPPSAL
jgi:hypothetical protein